MVAAENTSVSLSGRWRLDPCAIGRPYFFVLPSGNGCQVSAFGWSLVIQFRPGKQHSRRLSFRSISIALSTRRWRVSANLAVVIDRIQSRRAFRVMLFQLVAAVGLAARAAAKSAGVLSSFSSSTRVISTVLVSPGWIPAASRIALLKVILRPPLLSDWIAARNGKAFMMPSTVLASTGRAT